MARPAIRYGRLEFLILWLNSARHTNPSAQQRLVQFPLSVQAEDRDVPLPGRGDAADGAARWHGNFRVTALRRQEMQVSMSTTYLAADNFLLPNGTIIAELLLLLLILFVFWKFVLPPLFKSMEERENIRRRAQENYEQAMRKLRAAEEKYDRILADARVEAARIRDRARADGARILAEMREEAAAEVEHARRLAEAELATQRERVIRELRPELGVLAMRLAEKLLGYELVRDEDKQLIIERFLVELEWGPSSGRAEDRAASHQAG
ncbi:MAG TPA: F0F1 ATP synthase subunit B [Pseudonocardia sp.]|uniref:F0F1 ATP synthase subunit B n=1 Tax=Pseudonocardia sp. TaxID=60912 RepID=UPI002B77CFC1|nr:F0F1 ATP synthase subunit B [Pseudonocardia sp.]HTF55576.1 F0F1 ATP synthase subunit B [Pseudonocardia sp.]